MTGVFTDDLRWRRAGSGEGGRGRGDSCNQTPHLSHWPHSGPPSPWQLPAALGTPESEKVVLHSRPGGAISALRPIVVYWCLKNKQRAPAPGWGVIQDVADCHAGRLSCFAARRANRIGRVSDMQNLLLNAWRLQERFVLLSWLLQSKWMKSDIFEGSGWPDFVHVNIVLQIILDILTSWNVKGLSGNIEFKESVC